MSNIETMLKIHLSVPLTIAFIFSSLFLTGCGKYEEARENLKFAFPEYFKCDVMQVVEADTFHCRYRDSDIEKVGLISVEVPESVAEMATEFARLYLRRGTPVKLELDEDVRYSRGRMLAYVYLPGGEMLNALLIQEGYAKTAIVPPNAKYKDLFSKLQAEARDKNKGLWKGE